MALWTPGQEITADKLNAMVGEWTAWVPTITTMTLGNGTVNARYMRSNNRILATWIVVWGSTSAGNMPALSVPITPASAGGMRWNGSVLMSKGSGNFKSGVAWLYDTSTVISTGVLFTDGAHPSIGNNFSAAGITMATGGWISGSMEYEVD